jgi:hypothetical protein
MTRHRRSTDRIDLWTGSGGHTNPFWRVAYHTLFYTHLYLQPTNRCDSAVDDAVNALDLNAPHSGFSWYEIPKLEHQIVNIRHIQYHQAQLADRLRKATGGASGCGTSSPRRAGHRPGSGG